jgi:putative redox protein
MVKIKTPMVPIEMTAEAPTAARTHVQILDHEMVMDEPLSRHGTDLGPTPLDTLVAALAGCTNVVANRIAEENGIDVSDLAIGIRSEFDVRGIRGIKEIDRPLPYVDLVIRFSTSAPDDKLEILKAQLSKRCAVSVIFRQAGIEVNETWDVKRRQQN